MRTTRSGAGKAARSPRPTFVTLVTLRRALGALALLGLQACAGSSSGGHSSAADESPYDPPADWNVHTVAASTEQGAEPLNFILTADSTVAMNQLVTAIQASQWQQVGIGTGILSDLADNECISAETATVDADPNDANTDQTISLRVNGCDGIVESGENHARAYPQSSSGAWFVAVAKEYPCLIAAWPPWWHCIDTDGYDTGRDEWLEAVQSAANDQGWNLQCRSDSRPTGTGLNGITYDGYVYVCTLSQ